MIRILPYDPDWPHAFSVEASAVRAALPQLCALEHFGSTAVPGLAAKPVIDMMAALDSLDDLPSGLPTLSARGYQLVEIGMRDRLFLQRPGFNLHVVTWASWPRLKERLFRDALIADPQAVARYGALKLRLAATHGNDLPAYTRAKTAFVQEIMDQVHDRMGWPREDVWED